MNHRYPRTTMVTAKPMRLVMGSGKTPIAASKLYGRRIAIRMTLDQLKATM